MYYGEYDDDGPNWYPEDDEYYDDDEFDDLEPIECAECGITFPDWPDYRTHYCPPVDGPEPPF